MRWNVGSCVYRKSGGVDCAGSSDHVREVAGHVGVEPCTFPWSRYISHIYVLIPMSVFTATMEAYPPKSRGLIMALLMLLYCSVAHNLLLAGGNDPDPAVNRAACWIQLSISDGAIGSGAEKEPKAGRTHCGCTQAVKIGKRQREDRSSAHMHIAWMYSIG